MASLPSRTAGTGFYFIYICIQRCILTPCINFVLAYGTHTARELPAHYAWTTNVTDLIYLLCLPSMCSIQLYSICLSLQVWLKELTTYLQMQFKDVHPDTDYTLSNRDPGMCCNISHHQLLINFVLLRNTYLTENVYESAHALEDVWEIWRMKNLFL